MEKDCPNVYYVCVHYEKRDFHEIVIARSFDSAFWRTCVFFPNALSYSVTLCEFLDDEFSVDLNPADSPVGLDLE